MLAPGASQIHLAIGSLHPAERDYERSLKAFRAALKSDPYSVAALSRMGEVHLLTRDISAAEESLGRAIAINPAAAASHETLGRVYFRKREYRKSVEHLRSALRLGIRSNEDFHYHLGRAHQMLGNGLEAERHVAIVQRLKEAQRSIAQEHLGLVSRPAHRKSEAWTALQSRLFVRGSI